MTRILVLLAMGLFASATRAQDVRINIGGGAFTDAAGNRWLADTRQNPTCGGVGAIADASPAEAYTRGCWWTSDAAYEITVDPAKTYRVRLHLAETWAGGFKPGGRLFFVDVTGQPRRGPIDIFAKVGANRALVEEWVGVRPAGGKIRVGFVMGAVDNPAAMALELLAEATPPPQPGREVELRISWSHATANEDGSALTDRAGYRVERAGQEAGPWTTLATVGKDVTTTTQKAPAGRSCVRVVTLAGSGESLPSAAVCVEKPESGPAPVPPADVSVSMRELALVSGASTGTRAVYGRTSQGSRGPRLGDLKVGPIAQLRPPVDRVKCDANDIITAGSLRYARVIDPRVAEPLRGGYVTGCVSYGLQ